MAIIESEFGNVSAIRCREGVPTTTYENGKVPVDINTNRYFNYGYPENCPRVTNSRFIPQKEIGCIACPSAIVEFNEAELSVVNCSGEVLTLQV